MTDQITTIQDVESLAAKVGITFSSEDYAQAQALTAQRLTELQAQDAATEKAQSGGKMWVDRFNKLYPRILKALQGIGDVSISLAQTAIVALGVPVTLIILMIVEQQRVYHGVALFEVDAALASFSAWALVILNLVLELLVHYVEHKAAWQEPPRHEFSLRLLSQRIAYMLGRSSQWQARAKSPAIRFRAVLRIVTFSILTLALAGSMRGVIEQTQGNWFAAIGIVVTDSTLLEMITWLGGLLFAVAAVLSAQALSQYAARKAIEIAAALASNQDNRADLALKAAGMSGAAYLYARLKDYQRQRRALGALPVGGGGDVTTPVTMYATVQSAMPPYPSAESPVQRTPMHNPTPTPPKLTPKVAKVVAWLQANPDHGLSVRAIADLLGVSPTTVQVARKVNQPISSPNHPHLDGTIREFLDTPLSQPDESITEFLDTPTAHSERRITEFLDTPSGKNEVAL